MAKDRSILDMGKEIIRDESQIVPISVLSEASTKSPVDTSTFIHSWVFEEGAPSTDKMVRKQREDPKGTLMKARELPKVKRWDGLESAYVSNIAYDESGTEERGYYGTGLDEGSIADHRHTGIVYDIISDALADSE